MANEIQKVTSFSSIVLIVLKEVRLERNIHQAQLAEICDRTPSAWTKIESGKTPLTMEIFFKVCNSMMIQASHVLGSAELYAGFLARNGLGIMSKQLEFEEDWLLKEVASYYASAGFKRRIPQIAWNFNISILNGPRYDYSGNIAISDVFRFCLDDAFKAEQLEVGGNFAIKN